MHENQPDIAPFAIRVPEDVLADLRTRLSRTRWIDDLARGTWDRGLSTPYLRTLIEYWIADFDWQGRESGINRLPQFRTTIEGTKVHFVHQRGQGPDPLPLVLTHGFPDSFLRFEKIIPMLADPASHGGDPVDAFDVVVPGLAAGRISGFDGAHGGPSARAPNATTATRHRGRCRLGRPPPS